jgi:16S rRNA (uracil1498-N3)-methyltransferase
VWLAFAMIKNKSELVVEKATELGVSTILPVVTQHSVVKHANIEKLEGYAIEAAEQCERHDVPRIIPQRNLASLLGDWPKDRILLYGDETGGGEPLQSVIAGLTSACGVLIGPEGGFSADEIRMLRLAPFAKAFGMGPRILRADTAAVAALACIQSVRGDWQQRPHFKGMEE